MNADTSPTQTTIVVGASRGLGRGIATALADAGAPVIAVARTARARRARRAGRTPSARRSPTPADPTVAGSLLDRHEPSVRHAGRRRHPAHAPAPAQTWETFSVNWHTDVRIAFHWLREACSGRCGPAAGWSSSAAAPRCRITAQRRLRRRQGHPALHHRLRPGRGKPRRSGNHLHRGAAPDHAAHRARPPGRPGPTRPATASPSEEYVQPFGEPLTPELAGAALVELVQTDAASLAPGYLLTGEGLEAKT